MLETNQLEKRLLKSFITCLRYLYKNNSFKIKKGANVNTDVLLRICNVLNCDISDIVEILDESTN